MYDGSASASGQPFWPRRGSTRSCVTCRRKLHPQALPLLDALQGKIEDFLYAVNVQTDHGWKYHLKSGPMERKQWFETIHYDRAIFPEGEFEEFKNSVPENMVFFDIDGMRVDFPYSELGTVTADIRRGTESVLRGLTNYTVG